MVTQRFVVLSTSSNLSGPTNQRSYRTILSTNSSAISSLAELDVQSLKSLYDATAATRQTPTHSLNHNGTFTIEAFAGQVRALIERLRVPFMRFVPLTLGKQ